MNLIHSTCPTVLMFDTSEGVWRCRSLVALISPSGTSNAPDSGRPLVAGGVLVPGVQPAFSVLVNGRRVS